MSETAAYSTRFLRTIDPDAVEERAPVVDTLKALVTSSEVTPDKLRNWLSEGKSADSVFTRMHLAKTKDMLLKRPQFRSWVQYADDLSKASKKEMLVISTLTAQYGDDALYKLIESAKLDPKIKTLANRLEREQMQYWVAVRKSPDDVFRIYKLDEAKQTVLSTPKFVNWVKHVDDLNAKHPEQPVTTIPTLKKYFNIDDEGLLSLISVGKQSERTKSIASKVEDDLLQIWGNSKKTPDAVLDEMRIDKMNIPLLENSLFTTWAKYVSIFNAKYPNEKRTMIEILTRKFGDQYITHILYKAKSIDTTKTMATQLESAQLTMWRSNDKSVDDVFDLLWLRRRDHDFCSRNSPPILNACVSYLNVIATESPTMLPILLSNLKTTFDDRLLLQFLEAAKPFRSLERAVVKLETEKIRAIFERREQPKEAFRLLGLDGKGNTILSNPLFKEWMDYVKIFNRENPNKQESWFYPLRIHYGWYGVKKIIKTAMNNPNTVKIGKQVEIAMLKQWLEANHNPSEKETMIDILSSKYFDVNLLAIINAAKKDQITKMLATELEDALVMKWVAKNENPAQLLEKLRGIENADELVKRYTDLARSKRM
ncbi:hypothetical protein F442_13363 [Phytophthora nicotianae P10297]|uniref:RxLR effector PexRD54 WY domain-containing protein n=2 Tax=Phytophthora nicotianae TaxID=4792 RepID=W2YVI1_PHYNI|nr:hypothetical protein F442_13363 [Phytophthora nicotianae P10297]